VPLEKKGRCGVRQNIDGKLYSLVYGELVAEHIDPIEKKPLFHILPGSSSLSISTKGCNFQCSHCQNYSISQVMGLQNEELRGREVTPSRLIDNVQKYGCSSISYTYVEPSVFFEYAYDCAVEASQSGIKNVFVSNGYLSKKATTDISPYLDAINIDIKSFSDDFYHNHCGAKLKPVLDNVMLMKELEVWVEVTTLIIPGYNDQNSELKKIASFIASVDPYIPWHVTAFHPMYKMTTPPSTPLSSLERARAIGLEAGLFFVYEGNVPGAGGENTCCPGCGDVVIRRRGFSVRENSLNNGCCPSCSRQIPGVWL